ncbi:hypothetical protein F4778DRAFT_734455 [Xylariomycetidae sp. FL2044]|nr:hypothetical protein F4778DRAFT_734455 [Xylariomycetidae sp. FL2044]
MGDTSPPEASSSSYSRFFKSRPSSRKIQKRSSLPVVTSKPSTTPPDTTFTAREARDSVVPVAPRQDNNHSPAGRVRVEEADLNYIARPRPTTHHRARSSSAVWPRTKDDDNLLKPVNWSKNYYILDPVAGPQPSVPIRPGFSRSSYAPRDSSTPRMNRSSLNGGVGPTQAQRSTRLPPAFTGDYAQIDTRPAMYQRRPSSTGSSIASSMARESFDAILASPASSRTSFDSWQSSPRRSEYGIQRPAPIKQYRRRREPGELLAALPTEVLELILEELRELHLQPQSISCATCMMRDLCSVAVSAKKLLTPARIVLYGNIQLVGADLQSQKKRYKLGHGSRLILLRRTLRSNPDIAALVHTLKAPALPQGVPMDLHQNLVASVIMACPNFERLVGFHQNFDHSFNRLFHALSTREHLKEMHWTLEASQFQRKRRMSNAAPMLNARNPNFQEAPGDLPPQQSAAFFDLHVNWTELTTLSLHCLPGATLTPVSLLPDILTGMPALQTLHLSHLPFTAFNDANLLSLPSLKTLTLSHLTGISSEGLSSFARRPTSRWLQKLTLHHIDVDSLPTLGQILSHLPLLETFSLVQTTMPAMPDDQMIWLFPYLASSSIRKLHWDVTSHPSCASIADSILARSIAANGFPSLTTLRTPNDPEGVFQALCKPVEHIETPGDKYRGLIRRCTSNSRVSPPATPTTPKSTSSGKASLGLNFPMADQLFPSKVSSNLSHSRTLAQARLEAARSTPRFTINVVDDDGTVLESLGLAGYMGLVGSSIDYCLLPDEGATDENGGLVDIADVLGDGGENLTPRAGAEGGGCNGRWNTWASGTAATADRKEKERWWHTERGRWRPVEL